MRCRWWTPAKRRSKLLPSASPAFDVMILDVMLPGKDGFTVISELRAGRAVRAHPDPDGARPSRTMCCGASPPGADDYLTKPFELAILIARIGGLLRRREWLEAPHAQRRRRSPDPKDVFTFGDKSLHFDALELRVRGQVFPLTLMEANVLSYLIQHEGKPVSRKAMLEDVWGLHEDTDTRAIDNFIVRLRRYIEDDPTKPRHLLTVRGVGYRFVSSPAKAKVQ